MQDIEYYKKCNYKMIFYYDPEDKIYIVQFPELPGCIAHGETAEEALKNAYAVKDEWLKSALKDKWIIPEPSLPLETTGRITLRMPKSIHQRIIERAEEEDISQNQLILTYIAEGLERANLKNSVAEILQKQTEIVESLNKYQATTIWTFPNNRMPVMSDEASQGTPTLIAANALVQPQLNRPTYFGHSIAVSANQESNEIIMDPYKQKEKLDIIDSCNPFFYEPIKHDRAV